MVNVKKLQTIKAKILYTYRISQKWHLQCLVIIFISARYFDSNIFRQYHQHWYLNSCFRSMRNVKQREKIPDPHACLHMLFSHCAIFFHVLYFKFYIYVKSIVLLRAWKMDWTWMNEWRKACRNTRRLTLASLRQSAPQTASASPTIRYRSRTPSSPTLVAWPSAARELTRTRSILLCHYRQTSHLVHRMSVFVDCRVQYNR